MQGNEAARVDKGDIERKSDENEKLPIVEQSVIKNQGVMQIPNYEILEKIGEGGFAIVYKARREKDSLLVAIKVPKVPESVDNIFTHLKYLDLLSPSYLTNTPGSKGCYR
jgi:serine/threonine protein kinase